MDVTVSGKRERKLTDSEEEARKAFGAKGVKKLRARLDDLNAAPRLGDLPSALRAHALNGERKGQFAVTVCDGIRIAFVPREPIPKDANGAIDWLKIEKIDIVFIGDYH